MTLTVIISMKRTIWTIFLIHLTGYTFSAAELFEGSTCNLYDGSIGTCKSLVQCNWVISRLRTGSITYDDIRQTTCCYVGNEQIVCCGDERPSTERTTLPSNGHSSPNNDDDDITFLDLNSFESTTNVVVSTSNVIIGKAITFNDIHHDLSPKLWPKPMSIALTTTTASSIRNIPTIPLTRIGTTTTTASSTIPPTIRTTSPTTTKQPTTRTTTTTIPPTTRTTIPTTIPSPVITPTTTTTTTTTPKPTIPSNPFWEEWSPLQRPPQSENEIDETIVIIDKPIVNNNYNNNNSNIQMNSNTNININNNNNNTSSSGVGVNDLEIIIFNDITVKNEQFTSNNNNNINLSLPLINSNVNDNIGDGITTTNATIIMIQSPILYNNTNVPFIISNNNNNNSNGKSNDNDLFPPATKAVSWSTETTPLPPRINTRKTEAACQRYTKYSSPFLSFQILGGISTDVGEFPHMAAIGYPSEEINSYEYKFDCGGTIISERYILTAAHCIPKFNKPTVVRMGKVTLHTNDDGTDGITANIEEIISHPSYSRNSHYNDIALIKLVTSIAFNEKIHPACLRTSLSDIDPNVELTVTGWGATTVERAERSGILLKTNVTAYPLDKCNRSIFDYNPNDRRLRHGIELSQICAYDPLERHDTCYGDSGGPLQIVHQNGMSTIVGVTSFGVACGSLLPSVYTRVAYYIDWIESIVWP